MTGYLGSGKTTLLNRILSEKPPLPEIPSTPSSRSVTMTVTSPSQSPCAIATSSLNHPAMGPLAPCAGRRMATGWRLARRQVLPGVSRSRASA
ncbi:GTP-binding protein [Vreelandella salicampi]|uniref:GTP-binding protein n=1 Tax=Vreelandella salicampi TaxID=1449798 RepID=UPI001F51127C|nr:GTP-binding protein [Halomonas salicampi]